MGKMVILPHAWIKEYGMGPIANLGILIEVVARETGRAETKAFMQ